MVCSYWRKVLLATSWAWAYVGMLVWRRWSHGDMENLKVALARSRTVPLDVVLRRILADRHGLVPEAFDLLLANVHRWKRAEIKVPASRCIAVALERCFRQSTPFLTLLVITADAPVTVEVKSFFPDAPRLATLAVDRINLSKSVENASIYLSLTTLKLTNHISLVILATLLSTCAKTLRDLRLENIRSHLGDLDEHVFSRGAPNARLFGIHERDSQPTVGYASYRCTAAEAASPPLRGSPKLRAHIYQCCRTNCGGTCTLHAHVQ